MKQLFLAITLLFCLSGTAMADTTIILSSGHSSLRRGYAQNRHRHDVHYHRPSYNWAVPRYIQPVIYQPAPITIFRPAPFVVQEISYEPISSSCRPYQSIVSVGGDNRVLTGTACLQADGSWRIVN